MSVLISVDIPAALGLFLNQKDGTGVFSVVTKPFRRDQAMKRKHLRLGKGFRVAIRNSRSQAAEMVIEPGERKGGPENSHRGADQCLHVISSNGSAAAEKDGI